MYFCDHSEQSSEIIGQNITAMSQIIQNIIYKKFGVWGKLIKIFQDYYLRVTATFLTRLEIGRKNKLYNTVYLQKGYDKMTDLEKSSSYEPYVIFKYLKELVKKHPDADPTLMLDSERALILASATKSFIDRGFSDDEIEAALKKKPVNNSGYTLTLHSKASRAQDISDRGGYNTLSDYMKSLIFIPTYAVNPPANPQAVLNARKKSVIKNIVPEYTPEANNIFDFITNLIYNLT